MSYFAKKKLLYYKVYKADIWGLIRNNLQYKVDRVNYDQNNIFFEAKLLKKLSFINAENYKWNKFIVYNTIKTNFKKKKKKLSYEKFIHKCKVKSIFYFYLLFYFFRTSIKNRLYKIYKEYFFNKSRKYQNSKYYFTPFIYEPRVYNVFYKRHKMDAKTWSLQLVRLFYIIYSYKQLNKLIKKAKRADNAFENKFISLMECKLPSYIYRSSFFSNMFESISFIKSGGLWVNKEITSNLYYTIKITDFVGFCIFLKGYIFWSFFKRIRRKAFLFLYPKYMYVSLVFFLIILIRVPLNKDIINPVAVDAYKISNYI
jgi:ribosomal protein S4